MNTIPIIFNERKVSCTIIGGTEAPPVVQFPVAAVLLNEDGTHYRTGILQELIRTGFCSIISMERSVDNYNIEDLSRRFPSVKFIIPLEPVTPGEMINLAIAESDASHVMVVKDSLKMERNCLTPHVVKQLIADNCLCLVPRLLGRDGKTIPVRFVPNIAQGTFEARPMLKIFDGCPTLYPFECIGFYNKLRFMELGGFDYTLASPYWQTLDFALRGWLWGEKILLSSMYQFSYDVAVPVEDITPDMSQLRFFLKNIAPKMREDHAYIPINRFFRYYRRSSCSLRIAYRQFSDARNWTEKNKYRFRYDVVKLIESWEYDRL